jgi:hypothetical protein
MTALALTVTVDAYAATLTVTGGTAPYMVTASPAGRDEYPVRGTWADGVTVDGDVPLAVPTMWTVRDSVGDIVASDTFTVAANGPVLSDATDPTAFVAVTVVSQPPNTWEAATRTWDVLGTSDAFVSQAPMKRRTGDLVLYVPPLERADLLDLLSTGAPLLLRSPDHDVVDDVFLAVSTVRDALANSDAQRGGRLITLTYTAVSRDLGKYTSGPVRTWADLPSDAATWADVPTTFATWRDVRSGVQL